MEIADQERISRFLLFKRWFKQSSSKVNVDAFIPPRSLELSVSCTEGLAEQEIWPLGLWVVEQRPDNVTLYGRGDLTAQNVRTQGLEVERDDNPPRHANITGWVSEDKPAQRMKAVELAAASKLVMHEI
jgi:hypothetical protein